MNWGVIVCSFIRRIIVPVLGESEINVRIQRPFNIVFESVDICLCCPAQLRQPLPDESMFTLGIAMLLLSLKGGKSAQPPKRTCWYKTFKPAACRPVA
eukprot:394896-Hanusia_phi.AAC.1